MGVSLTSPTTLTAPDGRTKLRHRLITIRSELVERMARDRTEGGTLALLAGVRAATKAIETGEAPVDLIGGGAPAGTPQDDPTRDTPASGSSSDDTIKNAPKRTIAVRRPTGIMRICSMRRRITIAEQR